MAWGTPGSWNPNQALGVHPTNQDNSGGQPVAPTSYNLPNTGLAIAPGSPAPGSPAVQPTQNPTTPAPTPTTDASQQQDALAIIKNELASWGLGSLADQAWSWVTAGQGLDQILFNIRQTPEYAARFPGMAVRKANGLPAISEAQYTQYEDQVEQSMRAAGIPHGFYDSPAEIGSLIGQDVSASEVNERIQKGYVAASMADPFVKQTLSNYYGIDQGHLAAYYLDPTNALPLLERQLQSAQIGGAAAQTGYGNLDVTAAEGLASQGVTEATAQKGFNNLASLRQLFTPLPGQAGMQPIGQGVQLGAEFGQNADDQRTIQNAEEAQTALFKGGGGYATSNQGISGLGTNRQ